MLGCCLMNVLCKKPTLSLSLDNGSASIGGGGAVSSLVISKCVIRIVRRSACNAGLLSASN